MLGVDAEQALGYATDKFIDRFALVESMAADAGKEVSQLPFETLDAMWNRAKELIKQE
jgi:tetrapyrrole methylase family protein/MazG family protein